MEINLLKWENQPREATVSWLWDDEFFFETDQGNFIWKCPKYGGDSSFRKLPHSLEEYMEIKGTSFPYTYKGKYVTSSFIINSFSARYITYIDTDHLYE